MPVPGLRLLREQPVQTAPQITGAVVARLGARAPAAGVPAPPPDPSRARPSVPLHRLAAHGATRCVHPPNLPRQLESHSTVVPQGLTGYSGHTFWPTSSSPPIQLEQEKRPLPQRNTSQNGHTFWPITPTAFIKGLTQADLSERTGLSRPWINQFEQGKIENASIGRILTLCNALGITLTVSYGTPEETNETAPSNAQLSLSMPGHTLMSRAMRFWNRSTERPGWHHSMTIPVRLRHATQSTRILQWFTDAE